MRALRLPAVGTLAFALACGSKPSAPPAAPDAPTAVTATGAASQIAVQWTASAGATSYAIERSATSGGTYIAAGTTTGNGGTSFTDTGRADGETDYYVISAVGPGGTSPRSAEAHATTAPPAPLNLTATYGNASASLRWSASAGATGYVLSRGTATGGPYAQVATLSSNTSINAIDSGLSNGTQYFYVVQAKGAGSTLSVRSSEASVKPTRELCVLNQHGDNVATFDADASNDAAPLRSFGWVTGQNQPNGIALDPVAGEIFSLNRDNVLVFPASTATANIPPLRVLQIVPAVAIAVDHTASELMVASGDGQVRFYDLGATGAAAPKRTITTTPMNTAAYDVAHHTLITASTTTVKTWNGLASGAAIATITLPTSARITAVAYEPNSDSILVANSGGTDFHLLSYGRQMAPATPDKDVAILKSNALNVFSMGVDTGVLTANPAVLLFDITFGVTPVPLPLVSTAAGATFTPTQNMPPQGMNDLFLSAQSGAVDPGTALRPAAFVVGDTYNTIALFDLGAFNASPTGDIAPKSHIDGFDTRIFNPQSMDLDTVNDEIVLVSGSPNGALASSAVRFPRTSTGDVPALAPKTLAGAPGSGLVYSAAAADNQNHLFAVTGSPLTLKVFNRSDSGSATPLATLALPVGSPISVMHFDPKGNALFALMRYENPAALVRYTFTTPNGTPTLAMTGRISDSLLNNATDFAIDTAHDELVVAVYDPTNGDQVRTYARFDSGTVSSTPSRTFSLKNVESGSYAIAVDPLVGELFVAGSTFVSSTGFTGDAIEVFPRTATTGAAPLRRIVGPTTRLAYPTALVICN